MMKIDYDAVPGTSFLVDLDQKNENNENEKNVVLIPTPSDDPNDPLNWTRARKWMQLFSIIVFAYGDCMPGCAVSSIIAEIAASPNVDITIAQINDGSGYAFLFLGLGNLLWLPLAQQYGKRPIYLICLWCSTLLSIWTPLVKNGPQWIAQKILQGFFSSPVESLPAISIADMFFEHERGTYVGIYACALFSSNYIAPMIAGFVNDAMGWKWTIGFAIIFSGVCCVFITFFMEETNYERRLLIKSGNPEQVLSATPTRSDSEKNMAVVKLNAKPNQGNNLANQASVIEINGTVEYPPIKTLWQRMSLTDGVRKKNHLKEYIIMPFKMIQFPVVLYSGFLYGSSLFFYSILNTTESMVLSEAPYNFSASMCGLAFASPFIFVFLCYPIAGWSIDWLKIKFAKKHDGLSQAEDRLWVLAICMFVGPGGLILWGVGAAHSIHWFGIIIGLGIMAGLGVIGCVSSLTYTLDCYPQLNTSAMVVVIVIRNTMNFALDYGITPFIDNVGLQNTFIACAMICLFCISTFLVMEYTGLYWRKRTAKKYWKLVAKYREDDVIS